MPKPIVEFRRRTVNVARQKSESCVRFATRFVVRKLCLSARKKYYIIINKTQFFSRKSKINGTFYRCHAVSIIFRIFHVQKITSVDHFMMLNLVNMRSFIRKLMKIWDPIQAYQMYVRHTYKERRPKRASRSNLLSFSASFVS